MCAVSSKKIQLQLAESWGGLVWCSLVGWPGRVEGQVIASWEPVPEGQSPVPLGWQESAALGID